MYFVLGDGGRGGEVTLLRRLGASQYEEHIVIELEEGD